MSALLQRLACLAGPFFLITLAADGQVSSIQGSVEDQDHQPLVGVTIRIERRDLAGLYNIRSDRSGRLFYAGLPIGVYRVSCAGDAESGVEVRTKPGEPVNVQLTCVLGENRPRNPEDRNPGVGREILDRVRADLDRLARDPDAFSPDETAWFNRARRRLVEFRSTWERGGFDGEALDEAIRGLNDLVERGRLRSRDRDDLAEDLRRLREFRERRQDGRGAAGGSGSQVSPQEALRAAFNEGMTALRTNDSPTAVAAFRRALEIDPNQDVVWANLAQAQASFGSLGEAQAAYRRAAELKPAAAAYRNNYAIALAKSGKIEQAWTQLEEAARLDPANAGQYFYNVGAILVNGGQQEGAERAFARSIEANPDYAEAARGLLDTLRSR